MPVPRPASNLTRREALALGAAAGVAASVGMPAAAGAAATVIGPGTAGPAYLRRSTYLTLVGETFTAGEHALRLTAVRDVHGAAFKPSLRGHEDAFALEFEGQADALDQDLHQLGHLLIGPFPMFLGPTGPARGTAQTYGVTVDRSVAVTLANVPEPAASLLRPADVDDGEPKRPAGKAGKDEPEASEPTPRDLEIVEDRRAAAAAPVVQRRRKARRARRKLRHTHSERYRFKVKQRARMRRTRSGWLRHHGR
jgi:hypothetical protein